MPEFLDHKDIDELIDRRLEPMHTELPGVTTWQASWCIDIAVDELTDEIHSTIENGGWMEVDRTQFSGGEGYSEYTMVSFVPTTNNKEMKEWTDHDMDTRGPPDDSTVLEKASKPIRG